VIVEAGEKSGTLLTAEVACRLGREVGVVPSRTSDEAARGSNALLRDGAHPILDPQDALNLLQSSHRQMVA
jgi:DNA processing protein